MVHFKSKHICQLTDLSDAINLFWTPKDHKDFFRDVLTHTQYFRPFNGTPFTTVTELSSFFLYNFPSIRSLSHNVSKYDYLSLVICALNENPDYVYWSS